MSEHAVRQAVSRMHMREVAIARPYVETMISDLQMAATTTREIQDKLFLERRGEVCGAYGFPNAPQSKPFPFANGIAIIPVTGTLINRFGSSYSSLTGYNFIVQMMKAAVADEEVKGIILDVNSYGGEAAGCFECSQAIYDMRGTKPIISVVDSNAYSAGYAIACAADRIYSIPSGGEGSIGVVCMHMDMSKMLDDYGVKITFIYSGSHKVDGNPYEPLPADVEAAYQKRVDASRLRFATLVAQNRGLKVDAIMATEAECFPAADALTKKLIDAIATPEQAMQAFQEDGSLADLEDESVPPGSDDKPDDESATAQPQEQTMTDPIKPGEQAAQSAADQKAATDKAASDARIAERARMSGITGCEEAKGREAMATHIANNTEMSVVDAKAMLAAAPLAAAAPAPTATVAAPAPAVGVNGFQQAMDAGGTPGIKPDAAAQAAAAQAAGGGESLAQQILRDQTAATGIKHG